MSFDYLKIRVEIRNGKQYYHLYVKDKRGGYSDVLKYGQKTDLINAIKEYIPVESYQLLYYEEE